MTQQEKEKQEVRKLKRVFGTVYFVQGMSGLPSLSIFYYMMNVLKLGPVGGQIFSGLTSFAWFIKPLWGWISDKFPILGYRRKPYFVIMASIALISWLTLGLCAFLKITTVVPYILFFNTAAMAYAFVDVVADAMMVEHGQRLKRVGSFVSFQWLMLGVAGVITALTSGWFQQKIEEGVFAYWMIFSLTGFFPLLTAYVGIKNIFEKRAEGYGSFSFWEIPLLIGRCIKKCALALLRVPKLVLKAGQTATKISLRPAWNAVYNFQKEYRTIWILMLFIIVWHFSPSISYAARMYYVKTLNFTPMIFGVLRGVNAFIWIFAILFFNWFARRYRNVQWDTYLYTMVIIGGISLALGFYYYLPTTHPLSVAFYFPWPKILAALEPIKKVWFLGWGYNCLEFLASWNRYHWFALFTDIMLGLVTMPAFLIPLTLAGEAASTKNAGMIYALLMSVSNLTNSFGDIVGGSLYKLFTASWMKWFVSAFENSFFNIAGSRNEMVLILQIFVYVSAFFTFLAIPFVWWAKQEFTKKNIKVNLAASK